MLNRSRIKEIEQQIAELQAYNERLQENNEKLRQLLMDRAYLIAINREGRLNKLTFIRDGATFVIETYGTFDDDLAFSKTQAGIA